MPQIRNKGEDVAQGSIDCSHVQIRVIAIEVREVQSRNIPAGEGVRMQVEI